MENTVLQEDSINFDDDISKIRVNGYLCYLCFVIALIAGITISGIFNPDFEMRYNITTYSLLNQIIGIICVYTCQLIIFIQGIKILVHHANSGRRLWFLSLSYLSVFIIVGPARYVLLAGSIDWEIIATEDYLIRQAYLSNPVLLICHLIYAFSILGLTIAFASLLLILKKRYGIVSFRTASILYFFQIGYFLSLIFALFDWPLFNMPHGMNSVLQLGAFLAYIGFLNIGDGLLKIDRKLLKKLVLEESL
ncbi:MAG: hypothetical protein HWN66_04365 [Candidatus Helarchaeota archaeon]|nr:hypothetical protein [Candidatus Helarchaeota archaeon]